MSTNSGYNVQAQLRYLVQWFREWSEMQRSDFLPVLAHKFVPSGYVNGLVSGFDSLECQDGRPPSLFQCRIKLFREWSETWSQSEREQLINDLKTVDVTFVNKYEEEIRCMSGADDSKVPSPPPELLEVDNMLHQNIELGVGDLI